MATGEPTPGMRIAQQRAEALTRIQIEAALKINSEYFTGEGLTNLPAILQALSTNFGATVPYSKTVVK